MKSVFLLRLVVPWLAILVLAFVNGAFRELVLVPELGDPWALLVSGLLLSACVAWVTWRALNKLNIRNIMHALGVGALWLVMTLIFEFGFGRFIQGKSWGELLSAYTFERGNLWPVVLLIILFCPALMYCYRSNVFVRKGGDG